MKRILGKLLVPCIVLLSSVAVDAARLTIFIDGDTRRAYDQSRGKVGRAEWTAAVTARKGAILTNDFQGVNIDVPADTVTSVGHFSVFFNQTGGYSTQAGNTAPQRHPTGVFVGTTGTGSTAGGNDETIQGLELRYETQGPVTRTLELRFDPPIFAWAADVYSVDGKGFGQGGGPDSNDHTTLHVLGHSYDLTGIFTYAGSGYNSFFGIVSDVPFSSLSFTAGGDGDRWRIDNVSIARASTGETAGAVQELEVATALTLVEGPTVDREGNVYFTDIMTQRIMKFSRDGVLSVFRGQSNAANGLLIDPQGRLVAAEGATSATAQRNGLNVSGKPRITRTDLKTGKVEILAERFEGKPLVGPNDLTIDGKGRVYFTDFNGGAVYRIDAPGKLARILAAPDIQRPNGIQISPDDRTLYLVEANGAAGGARMIRAYDLLPDGTVRNMRMHYNFYPGRSADGMSIDTQGNLYASAGMHRSRNTAETLDTPCGVYVISPEGKLLKFIPIPEDYITNNAFGGQDMKTLYITAGKTLYKVRSEIEGLSR